MPQPIGEAYLQYSEDGYTLFIEYVYTGKTRLSLCGPDGNFLYVQKEFAEGTDIRMKTGGYLLMEVYDDIDKLCIVDRSGELHPLTEDLSGLPELSEQRFAGLGSGYILDTQQAYVNIQSADIFYDGLCRAGNWGSSGAGYLSGESGELFAGMYSSEEEFMLEMARNASGLAELPLEEISILFSVQIGSKSDTIKYRRTLRLAFYFFWPFVSFSRRKHDKNPSPTLTRKL